MITLALLGIASHGLAPAPVELRRVFVKGEKAQYEVRASLQTERRAGELQTWFPDEIELIYKFNYEVLSMKSDGICVMRYLRPTMTQIQGETAESLPVTKVEKVNYDFNLTVSPVNEVIEVKENPKPKKPASLLVAGMFGSGQPQLQNFIGQFVGEIYRLALFVGTLDASMDFAPPLPIVEVEPGDTWKKTVGFSPQKLSGKSGKVAVQRLDYTYKYIGIVDTGKRKVHRIEGELNLTNDLAEFIHQSFNVKSDQTGLKEIPMTMKAKVSFDLDLKTHQTISGRASAEGGFKIVAVGQSQPVQEEKFKSSVTLNLLSLKRP